MPLAQPAPPPSAPRATRWPLLLALFFGVSLVEGMGVSHVLAFAPLYLQQLGADPAEVPYWTGLIASGSFVVGLPLVPFWGVWAERYGRGLIIARSAYVEALVLLLVSLSRTPLELAASKLLAGFQLGNTGVMYAALSAAAPKERVGFALAAVGAGSAVGFAAGPAVGGVVADLVGLRPLYAADAALSLLSGLAVTLVLRERGARRVPAGSVWRQAWEAVAGLVGVPAVRRVFVAYVLALLARHMVYPFLPLRVQELYAGDGLASVVGLVVGGTALAGALLAPAAGALGDRVGYARMLGWAAVGGAVGALALAVAPALWALGLAALLFAGALSTVAAMSVALLATVTPEERRSPTLNLALLPLYLGGIVGPALGAVLAGLGLRAAFLGAALPLLADAALARRLPERPAPRST